jgi:hypothetical protein
MAECMDKDHKADKVDKKKTKGGAAAAMVTALC